MPSMLIKSPGMKEEMGKIVPFIPFHIFPSLRPGALLPTLPIPIHIYYHRCQALLSLSPFFLPFNFSEAKSTRVCERKGWMRHTSEEWSEPKREEISRQRKREEERGRGKKIAFLFWREERSYVVVLLSLFPRPLSVAISTKLSPFSASSPLGRATRVSEVGVNSEGPWFSNSEFARVAKKSLVKCDQGPLAWMFMWSLSEISYKKRNRWNSPPKWVRTAAPINQVVHCKCCELGAKRKSPPFWNERENDGFSSWVPRCVVGAAFWPCGLLACPLLRLPQPQFDSRPSIRR